MKKEFQITKVLIIGAGTMGQGIAQWFAQQGVEVELGDANLEIPALAVERINQSWKKLLKKGKFNAEQVKSFSSRLKGVIRMDFSPQPDLFIEAIIEDLEAKKELFEKVDDKVSKETIFASNTSSISINKLCKNLPRSRKIQFLGLHFFNPVPIMKLVEIIQGAETDPELMKAFYSWFKERKKVPVLCQDGPGFIVNRLARNFYGEPLRIVKDLNREKIQQIDQIFKKVGDFKMGPFELLDLIGIDVNLSVTKSVWQAFGKEPRFAPHKLQEGMVQAGLLGKKTKEGFYGYKE